MGGAPTLLMVAILGVTYGWQPDGDQGVEYIIQIPPEQLAEIERMGEISSTIDPAVRGRVSRVIVKVGTEPLPHTVPPGFSRFSSPPNSVAPADYVAIPIPESGVALTPAPLAANGAVARESVMKPQTGASPGLSLPPSLNPSYGGGNGFGTPSGQPPQSQQQADFAKRAQEQYQEQYNAAAGRFSAAAESAVNAGADALRSGIGGAVGGNASVPPRTNSAAPNLQFTGDPNLARPRIGGPSTEPVNSRDNAWNNPTARWGTTTNPGATAQGSVATAQGSVATAQGTGAPSPIVGLPSPPVAGSDRTGQGDSTARSTSNFGQLPGGMTLPGSYPPAGAAELRSPYPAANGFERSTATNNGRFETGAQPTAQTIENPFQSRSRDLASEAARQTGGTQFGSAVTQPQSGVQPQPNAASQPASHPPGTWSVNAYGQPLDNQGRVLDPWGRPIETASGSARAARDDVAGRFDQARSITPVTQPPVTQPAGIADGRGTPLAGGPRDVQPPPRSYSDADIAGDRRFASQRPYSPAGETGMRTGGDALGSSGGSNSDAGGGTSRRPTVTAQPLFNGLLLISIVANVYLIFWLKNLRHQFRDLVAAKRIAGSGVTSV